MFRALNLALIIAVVFEKSDGKLPSTIKICSRNDPNIAKCIIESITHLQPKLATGLIDDDFNIPKLEPLQLDNIHIDRGPNFQVYLTNNVVTKGASNFKIEKLKVNANDLTFDFIIHLPKLEYKGKYDLNVRLVLINLAAKGNIKGKLEDYKARIKLRGKTFQKNGQTYLNFEKIQMKIMIGKSKMELENLFDGQPSLRSVSTGFITENSMNFASEIIPSLEKNLSEMFTKAANEIIANATFDELFPN